MSLAPVLLGLATVALLAAALGCGVGAVFSALRGQAIEAGLGLVLALVYGAAFLAFAALLGATL